jgi:GTPase SAR1 family protein
LRIRSTKREAKKVGHTRRRERPLPPGVSMRLALRGHTGPISRVHWSRDGQKIATASDDGTIGVWDSEGHLLLRLKGAGGPGTSISWSPTGESLVAGFVSGGVYVWDTATGRVTGTLSHPERAVQVAWSPNEQLIALRSPEGLSLWNPSLTEAQTIWRQLGDDPGYFLSWTPDGKGLFGTFGGASGIWNAQTGSLSWKHEPGPRLHTAAWSPDGRQIALATGAGPLHVVSRSTGAHIASLEASKCWGVAFSPDGHLLASRSRNPLELWRCDRWERLAAFDLPDEGMPAAPPNLAFHPREPRLAVSGSKVVHILDLDISTILGVKPVEKTTHYANAKVVLVGNTSVGKSGLGLVLSGRKFRPTESTHGRHVWLFGAEKATLENGIGCSRETLLWDLAGQPGYRLIHQLHLAEVAVALVLFDSRSETDPFAGVPYWARALDDASSHTRIAKFLVASRADRGGPQVSRNRIDEIIQRYRFDGFFETSAKRGQGVTELRTGIAAAIPWGKLPSISAPEVFRAAKDFLVKQKRSGTVLLTARELLNRFKKARSREDATEEVFSACLDRLQTAGLVRRLSFGGQVLLQPERLDDYCGWLAHAARAQPDGLGFVKESAARGGQFTMDDDRRLRAKTEERSMLLAMVEEVVGCNVAHRQATDQGDMLVFPSELNADLPEYPGGYSLAVAFHFEGPVSGIYATLAVTLINSTAFKKKALYNNAALFDAPQGHVCGFAVEHPDRRNDSLGRLVVFFDADTDRGLRLLFLRYVNRQLEKLAFEGTLRRERMYHCTACNYTIPPDIVARRMADGNSTVMCPIRGEHYALDDLAEQSQLGDDRLGEIDRAADEERQRQKRLTTLQERQRTGQFHVFLCHNSRDKATIKRIAARLLEQGVLAWVDEEIIVAGDRFAPKLEQALDTIRTVAVFVGPLGMGRWQDMEYQAALQRSVEERDERGGPGVRVIPVLLPGVSDDPELPVFLRGIHRIDLREGGSDDREGMRRLVAAIMSDPEQPF